MDSSNFEIQSLNAIAWEQIESGTIVLAIDRSENPGILHNITTVGQIFSNYLNPFDNKTEKALACHVFIFIGVESKNKIRLFEAEFFGISRHTCSFNDLSKEYTEFQLVVLKKEIREKIIGFTQNYPEYTNFETKTLEILKRKTLKLLEDSNTPVKLFTPKPNKNENANYNFKQVIFSPFIGKMNLNPFTGELYLHAKERLENSLCRAYGDLINGRVITDRNGKPKNMICSEIVSRLIKCAIVDIEIEKMLKNRLQEQSIEETLRVVSKKLVGSNPFFQMRDAGMLPDMLNGALSPYLEV